MARKFREDLSNYFLRLIPLPLRIKMVMFRSLKYWPNIDNPKTFNEKLAYLKLNVHDGRFPVLADKWAVREYVRKKIGEKYLSKVYDVISNISELNFESLPECFVAKPTNRSGEAYFVKNKAKLNKKHFIRTLNNWLNSKYESGIIHGEWWYANIPPKVMFEEWLTDDQYRIPLDFKFYVFNGRVQAIQVDFDRFTHHKINFYTREWKQLPFRKGNRPNKAIDPEKIRPAKLEEMIALAEMLADNFDFVRVDLYYLFNTHRIVFGEMTFTPGSGYSPFTPMYYDWKFGKLWHIQER
jgi:hypothetical protein